MQLICSLLAFLDGLKSRMLKNYVKDIENDPMIKDQMAGLGCLFVCTFGHYLIPILIAAHTYNNLGNEQGHENEDYESEGP